MLLLKEGLDTLQFKKGEHNLESFEKVLNWHRDIPELRIRMDNTINILNDGFFVEYLYANGKIKEVLIANRDTELLKFSFKEVERQARDGIETFSIDMPHLSLDIDYFLSLFLNLECKFEDESLKASIENSIKGISLENLEDEYWIAEEEWLGDQIDQEFLQDPTTLGEHAIVNEIVKLDRKKLLYDITVDGEIITENISEEEYLQLVELQNSIFNDLTYNFWEGSDYNPSDLISLFKKLIVECNTAVKNEMSAQLRKIKKSGDVQLTENELGNIIFSSKIYKNDIENVIYYRETPFEQLKNFTLDPRFDLNTTVGFISANRGNQRRVYNNSSDYEIDQIIVEFASLKYQNFKYIKEVFSLLGIPGELVINRHEETISVVYLEHDGKRISLSDVGFGFTQIIPIILKVINFNSKQFVFDPYVLPEPILIIEEPEANLHPNLQSKLADLFLITRKNFPELRFIIETHSEYLIRKLQYLTAKGQLETNDSVIYYFNPDKYVEGRETKVKKIEITDTGNLTDSFGPGFFDEVTQLQFDLMKVNLVQRN